MLERIRKSFLLLLAVLMLSGISAAVYAAEGEVQIATAAKEGWKTLSNGKIRYMKAGGGYYKGFHLIDGKRYYFNTKTGYLKTKGFTKGTKDPNARYYSSPTGELYTDVLKKIDGYYYYFQKNSTAASSCWRVINGNKYYFKGNFQAVTGLAKISGKYYVFDANGVLHASAGYYTVNSTTYLLDKNGVMLFRRVGNTFYNRKNEQLSYGLASEYACYMTACDIVSQITNPSMSEEEKISACFEYITGRAYVSRHDDVTEYYEGFTATFANDIFINGSGDCVSDGCACAYLFKALGYEHVYYCADSATDVTNAHGWCELNNLVYDPLFAQVAANGGYAKNYAAPYGTYTLWADIKFEIMPDI